MFRSLGLRILTVLFFKHECRNRPRILKAIFMIDLSALRITSSLISKRITTGRSHLGKVVSVRDFKIKVLIKAYLSLFTSLHGVVINSFQDIFN